MRPRVRASITRWQFARLIKVVCVTGAVLLPLVGGIVIALTMVIDPHERQARQEFSAAIDSKTEVQVSGVRGLCGDNATRCKTLGLEIDLPGDQQAVVKWAQGKPYSESITVWRKGNGNWTTQEPKLASSVAWTGTILVSLGAVAVAVTLLTVALSISNRGWYAISPGFLPERSERTQPRGGGRCCDAC